MLVSISIRSLKFSSLLHTVLWQRKDMTTLGSIFSNLTLSAGEKDQEKDSPGGQRPRKRFRLGYKDQEKDSGWGTKSKKKTKTYFAFHLV